MNEQERSVGHSRKATCALAIFGAAAVCSALPVWVLRPSAYRLIAFRLCRCRHDPCLLLPPGRVAPLAAGIAGAVESQRRLAASSQGGNGTYFTALTTLFLWGAAHSPAW
jgi:hypothetical protein